MYRLASCTTFVLLLAAQLFAQSSEQEITNTINSLKLKKENLGRAKALLDLAMLYIRKPGERQTDLDTAILLIGQAKEINDKVLHDKLILAEAFYAYSNAYRENGDTMKGHGFISKSLEIYKTAPLSDNAGEAYFEISRYYNWQNPQAANFVIEQLEKARLNFEFTGNLAQQGYALRRLADWNLIANNSGKALAELNQALALYKKAKNNGIEELYDLLNEVYFSLGDYPTAIEYGLLAEKAAIDAGVNDDGLIAIYVRLATSYDAMTNYSNKEATRYFQKALEISLKGKDSAGRATIINQQVEEYARMNIPAEGIRIYNKYKRSIKMSTQRDSILVYRSLLLAYLTADELSPAKYYAEQLIPMLNNRKVSPKDMALWAAYAILIDYFLKVKNYKLANQYAIHSIEMTQKYASVNARYTAFRSKAKVDSAMGNFESSLWNYKRSREIWDSVFNEKKTFQFAQMQVAYATQQKQDSLLIERQHGQLLAQQNKADMENARVIRDIIITSALVLSSILFVGYQVKKNSNKRLRAHEKEIEQKNDSLTRIIDEKNQLIVDKEFLVKEIHHRVKNNLQIVTSLLNTQSKYLENKEAIQAITESRHRMQAMSLLHQKLYQSDHNTSVNMVSYVQDLASYLEASFKEDKKIVFSLTIESIDLDITQAIPIGLIINEAITNAFKYAFRAQPEGIISISMKKTAEQKIILIIADNGQGLPDGFDKKSFNSMGMRLIAGLTKQINGRLLVNNNNGAEFIILFDPDPLFKQQSVKELSTSEPSHI